MRRSYWDSGALRGMGAGSFQSRPVTEPCSGHHPDDPAIFGSHKRSSRKYPDTVHHQPIGPEHRSVHIVRATQGIRQCRTRSPRHARRLARQPPDGCARSQRRLYEAAGGRAAVLRSCAQHSLLNLSTNPWSSTSRVGDGHSPSQWLACRRRRWYCRQTGIRAASDLSRARRSPAYW